MAKTMRKKNLKIQILAGNTLMSRFRVSFEIELPLVNNYSAKFGREKLDFNKVLKCFKNH